MPNTIKFSDNPNEETAFVTTEDDTRTRVVLTTPVEGTVKFPDNPNSTKVSVTVDGVARKAVAVYNLGGGGGGSDSHNLGYYATQAALEEAHPTAEAGDWAIVGSTDTVWVWDEDSSAWVDTDTKGEVTPDMIIVKSATMPSASTTPAKAVYQYTGATNATYTHGYIYENVKTATYTGTVSFEAATLSGTTVACSGDNFAAFLTEAGADPTPIVSGTMTYEADATGWRLVGKDSNGDTVTTFLEYVEDYQDAGFTFTGTPQDGDVVAFTCTVEEASASYAWNRIDVQPAPSGLPDQTGNAGKFLTTDGTDASWSDKPLVNTATPTNSLSILGTNTTSDNTITIGKNCNVYGTQGNSVVIGNSISVNYVPESVGIGNQCTPYNYSVCVGKGSGGAGSYAVSLGWGAKVNGTHAIQIGNTGSTTTNYDANTVKIANANGNFEIMSADGTIPTTRLTKVNTTITLAAADWSSNTQTVSVTGMTATGVVMVSPDPTDQSAYTSAGIICSAQAAGTLTFTCSTTPSADLSVNVVML